MNRLENLERDLAIWFADTAAPRVPDFTDDILRLTAGTRQRPRWSFPERWLPMSVITLGRQTLKPLPWRTIGLLAALALLIAAAFAFYIGSQPRLPAPFGLAANGLVAYGKNGDIYSVDPGTGSRQLIIGGPTVDFDPHYSLDGTRLAFRRATPDGELLVFANVDGSQEVVSEAPPLVDANTIAWSPDGRSVAFSSTTDGKRPIVIVDARTGRARNLDVGMPTEEVSWRPPDGRELLFLGGDPDNLGLFLVAPDGTALRRAVAIPPNQGTLFPTGWLPSGDRIVFQRTDPVTGMLRLHVVSIDGSSDVVIQSSEGDRFNAGFGRISNGGDRLLFLDGGDACAVLDSCNWLSVASVAGGPSRRITPDHPAPYGVTYQWSPDDRWILTRDSSGGPVSVIDPNTGAHEQPAWVADGAGSSQRLAP